MAIPERNMILVAVVLAILEKFTSRLGKLNFIWATTVLLGGFASDLVGEDFWFVSVILVAEGIRVFGRRGELHTSSSYLDNIIKFYSSVIQEYSAIISLILFIDRELFVKYSNHVRNRNVALKLFYSLSTVESALILWGIPLKWFSGVSPLLWPKEGRLPVIFGARWISKWVQEVQEGYHLDDSQIDTLYRFFHRIYSRCVRGSIFDSWKMTIVSYSVELLQSSDGDEQLKGATLLRGLVKEDPRALETLRSIGTIRSVVEMLIDMLNWDSNEFPEQIRVEAAEIIFNLVRIDRNRRNRPLVMAAPISMESIARRNRTLVMAAPDSMESIASLLYDGNQLKNNFEYRNLSKVGLCILKQLANDHDNRAKMGSNRGLLLKIITLTESNTRELDLRKLAIETLTSIARDQDFRKIIGCIDGVLHNLFSIFLMEITTGNVEVVSKAGEALGFLSLDNNQNCEIMKSIRRAYFRNLIPHLISLLNEEKRGTYAAIILRNLSAYLEAHPNENIVELDKIGRAAAQVVDLVTEKGGVHREAAMGLAAQIFIFLSPEDYDRVMSEPRVGSLISTLLSILGTSEHQEIQNPALEHQEIQHPAPEHQEIQIPHPAPEHQEIQHPAPEHQGNATRELPNIRRFSILLLIAIMRRDIRIIARDKVIVLKKALEEAMTTTSVLESYSTFSGTIGLRSDSMAIPFLAQFAIGLLDNVRLA